MIGDVTSPIRVFRKTVNNALLKIVNPPNISFRQWSYLADWTEHGLSLFLSLFLCLFLSAHQTKKRFEREWREAERAAQYAEKTDQDINATKADVEKVKRGGGMLHFKDYLPWS